MKNKKDIVEKLKLELMQIRTKIESSDDNLSIDLGFPKILIEIENELSSNMPNKERLENGAFGIFRLVTESYLFEKSTLGQELLGLRIKIKEFASTLAKSE